MFFATYVLTQKGPLAKVWLAAHWDKKLTSKDIKVIDLKETVVQVVDPSVPIALRTSGELMLGIVRIYALKVQHLLKDATEATTLLLKPRAINLVKLPAGAKDAAGGVAGKVGKEGANEMPQHAVAVTMDVTIGRIGAEQLVDADFGEVADLLADPTAAKAGAAAGKKGGADSAKQQAADDGAWWFATEASQTVEEINYNSKTDAEMAKFRAELEKSSTSGSKKGSSSTNASSIEQNRAQQGAAGVAGVVGDEFNPDWVAPNAQEEAELLAGVNIGAPMDLDALLNQHGQFDDTMPPLGEDGAAPGASAGAADVKAKTKKMRMVIVMDAETSLKPDQLKKLQDNRGDIVFPERRHGPLEQSEVADRVVLRDESIVADCSPLACYFNNEVLKAAFHTAVSAVADERIKEIEQLRGKGGFGKDAADKADKADKAGRRSLVAQKKQEEQDAQQDALQMPVPEFDDLGMPQLPDVDQQQAEDMQQRQSGRRCGRNENGEADETDGFSASTLAALQHLRTKLLAAGAKSTSLRAMVEGKTQQQACRTFVDLLHLASHSFIAVAQQESFGSIVVTRGPKFNNAV